MAFTKPSGKALQPSYCGSPNWKPTRFPQMYQLPMGTITVVPEIKILLKRGFHKFPISKSKKGNTIKGYLIKNIHLGTTLFWGPPEQSLGWMLTFHFAHTISWRRSMLDVTDLQNHRAQKFYTSPQEKLCKMQHHPFLLQQLPMCEPSPLSPLWGHPSKHVGVMEDQV